MNFISPELDIRILNDSSSNNPCIYFKFKGKFNVESALSGTKELTAFMDAHPAAQCEFVWDGQEMTGFEINARKSWYEAMSKYKSRIVKVYVISPNIMIRSAAKVMLTVFGIDSVINKSEEQLPEAIRI
ncbi:hypothetical protein [Ekhidna sp.]|uniref:hypothetical protein n=1 Tax=Ekhidna sp. TaxID=2608089 RepID=UPI003B502583